MTDEERRHLERRLGSARRRLADATPHSPDWDAAAEAVDELEDLARRAGLLLDDPPGLVPLVRPPD